MKTTSEINTTEKMKMTEKMKTTSNMKTTSKMKWNSKEHKPQKLPLPSRNKILPHHLKEYYLKFF